MRSHCPAKFSTSAWERGSDKHAAHFRFENGRLAQISGTRELQQSIVGNAAPQKEGQARCQFEVADAVHRARRGIAFDPEYELRAGKNALQRARMPASNPPFLRIGPLQKSS